MAVAAENLPDGAGALMHVVSALITMILMTNLTQFSWWSVRHKKGLTTWNKYGPVFLLILATLLTPMNTMYELLIELNLVEWDKTVENWTYYPGIYGGYFIMFCGIAWTTNLPGKLRAFFRAQRRG